MSDPESPARIPSSPSDQIGVAEIRRRVDAAIGEVFAERPNDTEWPSPREMARAVHPYLDAEVLKAIEREGLIRFVRRLLALKNRGRNKARQAQEGK